MDSRHQKHKEPMGPRLCQVVQPPHHPNLLTGDILTAVVYGVENNTSTNIHNYIIVLILCCGGNQNL